MEEQILAKLDRILAVTETIDAFIMTIWISSAVILICVIVSIIVSILRDE